jgi:hypothetical protein
LVGRQTQLKRQPVQEVLTVYRIVRAGKLDHGLLAADFRSDRELGAEPETEREELNPELLDGFSADKTLEQARRRWSDMRKAASRDGEAEVGRGRYIAECVLPPGEDFDYEDRKKRDGKLTIWGEPAKLAASVCRIEPADVGEPKGELR